MHQLVDDRHPEVYTYVRRPGYYAAEQLTYPQKWLLIPIRIFGRFLEGRNTRTTAIEPRDRLPT